MICKFEDGTESLKKPSKFQETVYIEEVKQWLNDNIILDTTLVSLYNIVWSQCGKFMRNKLIGMEQYDEVKEKCGIAALLKEIRRISNCME